MSKTEPLRRFLAFSLRSFAMLKDVNGRRSTSLLQLCQVSPIDDMTGDQRDYQAYLLRLWRINTGHGTIWHASLEDTRTGERKGFADLQGLLRFLEEQTNRVDQPNDNDKK